MRVLAVYGNPKEGGFVHGCVDAIADHLESRGVEVDRLRLAEVNLADCTGCFTCLGQDRCAIDDDGHDIVQRIRAADGLVCGASVRNGSVPAMFKRFYERITYLILFTGDIMEKYVLGVSAVGMATGKKATRRIVAMKDMGARTVGHLFFKTGIPTRLTVDKVRGRLTTAADKLFRSIERQTSPGPAWTFMRWVDRLMVKRFMLDKRPEFYANVIAHWRRRGWIKP